MGIEQPAAFDAQFLIDTRPVGGPQIVVILICALCLVLDGFDLAAMAFAAPSVSAEWGIPRSSLGAIFSAALFGVLFGSLGFGWFADRLGRRLTMILGTALFSAATLATAWTSDANELFAARLVTGLGLGGVIANALVMTSEFSPLRRRPMIVLFTSCGLPLGGMTAGIVSTFFLGEIGGWRGLFILGGVLPMLVLAWMIFALPESIAFSARLDSLDDRNRTKLSLARIFPGLDVSALTRSAASSSGATPLELVRGGFARATLLFCSVNFLAQLDIYFLSNWIPTVLQNAGLTANGAALAGTILQIGAVCGAVVLGLVMGRIGFARSISAVFVCGAVAIWILGRSTLPPPVLFAAAFIAGFCVVGAQPAVYAWATTIYPVQIRGTGLGWTVGIGRLGSVAGPAIGGVLLSAGWTNSMVFLAAAVPIFLAALLTPLVRADANE